MTLAQLDGRPKLRSGIMASVLGNWRPSKSQATPKNHALLPQCIKCQTYGTRKYVKFVAKKS